jgi:hypothetical protein
MNAMSLPGGEICPILPSPVLELSAMTDDGQPIDVNVTVIQIVKNEYGQQYYWITQTDCNTQNGGPRACFNGGHARISEDMWGSPLGPGEYMVMATSTTDYYPMTIYVNANSGVASGNILMIRRTASIKLTKGATAKAGLLTFEYEIDGPIPAGTEVYVIARTYDADWTDTEWEAIRETVPASENLYGISKKAKIFVPNALAGLVISADVYLSQRGAPSRPLAKLKWINAPNEK